MKKQHMFRLIFASATFLVSAALKPASAAAETKSRAAAGASSAAADVKSAAAAKVEFDHKTNSNETEFSKGSVRATYDALRKVLPLEVAELIFSYGPQWQNMRTIKCFRAVRLLKAYDNRMIIIVEGTDNGGTAAGGARVYDIRENSYWAIHSKYNLSTSKPILGSIPEQYPSDVDALDILPSGRALTLHRGMVVSSKFVPPWDRPWAKKEESNQSSAWRNVHEFSVLVALQDGKFALGGSQNGIVQVWKQVPGKCETIFGISAGPVPDAQHVVGGFYLSCPDLCGALFNDKKIVAIQELNDQKLLIATRRHVFLSDLTRATRLWCYKQDKCAEITALCKTSQASFVAGHADGAIRTVNISVAASRNEALHKGKINALCMLPDGRLASAADDGLIKIWQIVANGSLQLEETISGHSDAITALDTLPNGNLVSGSSDRTVKIWSRRSHVAELDDLHQARDLDETLVRLNTPYLYKPDKDVPVANYKDKQV